jgi:type III secretion YscU/HrpY family protein
MADSDTGDKTEKPTPKRLEDARKKGDVVKSREITSTAGLVLWLGLGTLLLTFATVRIAALFEALFDMLEIGWMHTGFAGASRALGALATELALLLTAMLMLPAAGVAMLTDFLQAGPVLTFDKIKPSLEHMNPVAGVKRMFSMDNLVEVLKAVAKAALLFLAGWLLVKSALPDLLALARSPQLSAQAVGALAWSLTIKLMAWSVGLCALVSILDAAWQRHSFMKKMRMSMRDIRQESKEDEGDPHVKQQRRQVQQEWTQRNSEQAARKANVLVVNPTHVAIAIDYDREFDPVPTVSAKGQDHEARAMREAAEEAGVPVVRNVPLARDLLARAEIGEIVPSDLFDIIAEVILWADAARRHADAIRDQDFAALSRPRIEAPGEDLTRYPEAPWNRSQ